MQQWQSFWQSVSAASLVASIGAVLRMYSLGVQQAQQIEQLKGEVKVHGDRIDGIDRRVQAIEVVMARIDANVGEMLEMKRMERRASLR